MSSVRTYTVGTIDKSCDAPWVPESPLSAGFFVFKKICFKPQRAAAADRIP